MTSSTTTGGTTFAVAAFGGLPLLAGALSTFFNGDDAFGSARVAFFTLFLAALFFLAGELAGDFALARERVETAMVSERSLAAGSMALRRA